MPNPYPIGVIEGVELYKNDVVVIRHSYSPPGGDCARSVITEFSERSRRRLAFIAANTTIVFDAMITLTYPEHYPHDGAIVKKHFRAMMQALRRRAGDRLSHLWFIEFQKRGAPHYHILTKGIHVDKDTRLWLAKRWYTICDSGDPKHARAGTRLERIRKRNGAARYAVKYAYKMRQKRVPKEYRNVGRFWGHSSDVKPDPIAVVQLNEGDIVAALELAGWQWLRGDTIWYHTLYGASDALRSYLNCDMLTLSVSKSN